MNRRIYLFALLLLVYAGAATAAEWRMDRASSKLAFQVSYQGEAAPGRFKQFDTHLRFDPAHPASGALRVTIELTSIDMGSAELNQAVHGTEWFDLAKFTEAEFHSSRIEHVAADRYLAHGTLSLKGTQRPVEVPFTWKPDGKTATMAGELTLDRTAFGIGTGEWASADPIGLGVKVSFNVRLRPAG